MCFTVEIDKNRFPDVSDFIDKLDSDDILYMSNEYDAFDKKTDGICYRFEFDNSSVQRVSMMLAELIRKDYLNKYADNVIDTNYYGVDICDKQAIISNILNCTDTDRLSCLISEFVTENMHIHLGGFVLFRIKEYLTEFEDEIDFAVDEYIQEKRYRDFVKFLKFFLDIQDSVFDKVNIVLKGDYQYKLLDENGVPISKDLLDSTYCEISALEDDDEYIMLNDLISLAPKHVTVHCRYGEENSEHVKIIKEIFTGRVDFCYNCSICSK